MNFRLLNILRWLFLPHFNEVALFSMSVTCILLISTNFDFGSKFNGSAVVGRSLGVLFIAAIFIVGICLSFYHAISEKRKSSTEKLLMLIFASIVSGFGGIWAGAYLWYHTDGWLRIVPIWNIISGYILLASIRETHLVDQRISDTDATLSEILFCTLITCSLFWLCQYFFDFHWAATFSITVAFATNYSALLVEFLVPARNPTESLTNPKS